MAVISQGKHVNSVPKLSFIINDELFPLWRARSATSEICEMLPEHSTAKQQQSYIEGKSRNHQEACNYVS